MLNRRNTKVLSIACLVICLATFILTDPLIGDGSPQEMVWREKKGAAHKALDAAADDIQAHAYDRAYVLRRTAEFEAAKRDFDFYYSLGAAPLAERARLEHFWYCVAGCFGLAAVLGAFALFVHDPPSKP